MAYQETSTTNYGQRLKGSFKGIAFGFALFAAGTASLFWNEGNFVKTKKSIHEAEKAVVNVADVSAVDASLNGKLIHATAFAGTEETLTDAPFGVSETAIAIRREVEYYQYKENSRTETKDRMGGGQEKVTTYTYETAWVTSPVSSANFHDPEYRNGNFVLAEAEPRMEQAKLVTFGAYRLPDFIISGIQGSVPATANMTADLQKQWEKAIADRTKALRQTAAQQTAAPTQMVHTQANTVYFGSSPFAPAIGDVRVTFAKTEPAVISIIAKINGDTFEHFYAKNGKAFADMQMGTASAEKMFADAHSVNRILTWLLRLLGVIFVYYGLKYMFDILPALFNVLPFLANIVSVGIKIVCGIVGFAWSLLIIAVAWLFYRPLIGISLLAVAVAGIWYLKKAAKAKKAIPVEE